MWCQVIILCVLMLIVNDLSPYNSVLAIAYMWTAAKPRCNHLVYTNTFTWYSGNNPHLYCRPWDWSYLLCGYQIIIHQRHSESANHVVSINNTETDIFAWTINSAI